MTTDDQLRAELDEARFYEEHWLAKVDELDGRLEQAERERNQVRDALARVQALCDQADAEPDRRPRDKHGPIGRRTPFVLVRKLREALDADAGVSS